MCSSDLAAVRTPRFSAIKRSSHRAGRNTVVRIDPGTFLATAAAAEGSFIKSRWSHIPITFSQEDLQLKDYPHNDAMVISCVIKGFLVHNVLVDTGSAADIIFAKAFRQMQEREDKIHDATHPLCGFGGRQIVELGKITMQ